jgi:hypothetical protein
MINSLLFLNHHHHQVQKEVDTLHKKCSLLVNAGMGLERNSLEELYLFLKEKVASGEDLQNIADEMHEQVYRMCIYIYLCICI